MELPHSASTRWWVGCLFRTLPPPVGGPDSTFKKGGLACFRSLSSLVTLPPPYGGPASTCKRWACLLPGFVKLCCSVPPDGGHASTWKRWDGFAGPCQELTGSVVKAAPTAHKCHTTRVKPCHHGVSKAETGRGKLIRHSSKAQKRTQLSLVAFTLKLAQSEGNRPSI